MSGGGGSSQAPAEQNNADQMAAEAQARVDANRAAVQQQILDSYRAQADRAGAPVPSYFVPREATTAQSPTLQLPGFQGVPNPYYAAPKAQDTQPQTTAQDLLAQYNAYRQKNAEALYQSRAAQLIQAQALQQAYADQQAAAKAKADAAARKPTNAYADFWRDNMFSGSVPNGASGGIASLQRGFK